MKPSLHVLLATLGSAGDIHINPFLLSVEVRDFAMTEAGGKTPAAMLVMHEMPSTSMPMWRATIASGTVDMPTASAPSVRRRFT